MPSCPAALQDNSYDGRILNEPCSDKLQKRLVNLLTTSRIMTSMNLPVLHYIAAWKDDRTDIWYEFADPRFCGLFTSRLHLLAPAFRKAVVEQKVYPSDCDALRVEMLEPQALNQDRAILRSKNIEDGHSEAIYKVKLPDDSCIWLKDQARLERFPEDKITLSVGVLTPVSREMAMEEALRRAEKALSQSEKQFRDLFAQSNDAILLLNPEGRILKVNKKAEELTGLSQELLAGKPACDLFPRTEQAQIRKVRDDIGSGRSVRIETLMLKDDGTLSVDINARQVINTDHPMIQAVVKDISIQKRLEAERSKIEKFDMLKTLAGGLVHDMNNMLSVIMGNLSLAGFESDLPQGTVTLLSRIENATANLKNITRKMLVLADADTGVRIPGQIHACIHKALDMLGPIPPEVRLHMDIPVILPAFPMDKKGISEAFASIMENSLDAMPKGGVLSIEVRGLRIETGDDDAPLLLNPGDYLAIYFRDTGSGIREKDLARIFDPYFSTKSRDARKGTGLGLSLAYAVIKQHGGHIMPLPPEEGQAGTTIAIYLPLS
ncbi:PAS domain S-box-containing protein [Desulfobotulus alkaliphilus]|uniref:histidine kinase n=1 Tax=Desulfobotulus alkaliphilus TaxID=622671 RepID=A0A562RZ40_9BACT|nr:PAS domain S-box protein [Desulfobotulus alkaliphilus]TWI74417.1 PAS domain S-box-containing protein [Desulfobotulus alkaliphilus]